ncbi:hypothetical protein CPB83DRAFT_109509 [Crepidotus variabilis]|uniref:Uncharacterized protein n=1 Tax=Crepidotus variabilis TaxID=179855 RepID=A0A9P6EMF6_9AGAR|nr:hypothetical protein CPB83DRAFT_109509 [Crepidotus variabilis]
MPGHKPDWANNYEDVEFDIQLPESVPMLAAVDGREKEKGLPATPTPTPGVINRQPQALLSSHPGPSKSNSTDLMSASGSAYPNPTSSGGGPGRYPASSSSSGASAGSGSNSNAQQQPQRNGSLGSTKAFPSSPLNPGSSATAAGGAGVSSSAASAVSPTSPHHTHTHTYQQGQQGKGHGHGHGHSSSFSSTSPPSAFIPQPTPTPTPAAPQHTLSSSSSAPLLTSPVLSMGSSSTSPPLVSPLGHPHPLGAGHPAIPMPISSPGGGQGQQLTPRGSMILYRVADPFATLGGHVSHFQGGTASGANTPTAGSRAHSLRGLSGSGSGSGVGLSGSGSGSGAGMGAGGANEDGTLLPPSFSHLNFPNSNHGAGGGNRGSVYSTSGDSIVSLSEDSKYPGISAHPAYSGGALIAYVYDPEEDEESVDGDEIDWLHDSEREVREKVERRRGGGAGGGGNNNNNNTATSRTSASSSNPGSTAPSTNKLTSSSSSKSPGPPPPPYSKSSLSKTPLRIPTNPYTTPPTLLPSLRGLINIGTLFLMVISILALFVVYPTFRTINENGRNELIAFNDFAYYYYGWDDHDYGYDDNGWREGCVG